MPNCPSLPHRQPQAYLPTCLLALCLPPQVRLYRLMTEPGSSRLATLISYFMFVVIIASTVSFCLESVGSLNNTLVSAQPPPHTYSGPMDSVSDQRL